MILIKKHRTEREEVEKILREKLHYIDYILKVLETRNGSSRHTINIFKLGVRSFENKSMTTDYVAENHFQTAKVNSALCSTEKQLHRQGFLPCTQRTCSLYSVVYCIFPNTLSSCEAKLVHELIPFFGSILGTKHMDFNLRVSSF